MVDLIVEYSRQSRIKENLRRRAKIVQVIRSFFMNHDYLEVDTPIRIPAPAPESHINAIKTENWFLQTSPELCMKRLLSSGYSRIFQISKCFRKGERGSKHLSEMSLLEWYATGKNYSDLMIECESLIRHILQELETGKYLVYQGKRIDMDSPWEKISVKDAFRKYAGLDLNDAIRSGDFDEIMGLEIEPQLGNEVPAILFDYPYEKGALAKRKSSDPAFVERFELYIAGIELCNAFSELTDPEEQRIRFEAENTFRSQNGQDVYPIPERFLKSLQNMPEASGIALGIDRLAMLFTDSLTIDEVTAFVTEEL